jgi:glycine/D-amino acid oxidase-like deaminating enzyme
MRSHKARRTPVYSGPAAWNSILANKAPPIAMDRDVMSDFVIIGAGFAGLAAAMRLKELNPTASIVVLEAGQLAEGASGRNSGFMIDLPHEIQTDNYAGQGESSDRLMIRLNRQAIDFAGRAVERYDIDRNFFDPAGKVNGAASEEADHLNRSFQKHLAHLGEPCELLDAKAMHEMTGSRLYYSGLYSPGTTMIQPAGYIRGIAEGLRKEGVLIFENSPVVKFEKQGASWQVSTALHHVSANKLILANNGHLESFGFASQRLMHIFLYASMTVELDQDALKKLGGQPRWGVTPSAPMGTTMRRIDTGQGGNRVITRTCAVFQPDMEPAQSHLARTARVHRQKFDERYPALRDIPMEYTWAGHLCLTRNGVAVMKELDENLYSGCVQNGLGTVRGTLTGIGAAELASGVTSDITQHFTSEAEPTLLPPPPLSTLGANLYLRWKEYRAGHE